MKENKKLIDRMLNMILDHEQLKSLPPLFCDIKIDSNKLIPGAVREWKRTPAGQFSLYKWTFKLGLRPDYASLCACRFIFGVFKFTSRPPEGEVFGREHYKGFLIDKRISIPFWEISL